MYYSREMMINVSDPRGVEDHFDKYGFAIVKHLSYYVAFLHGSEAGEMPALNKVQAAAKRARIEIRAYVCCFPLACKRAHPELNILGGWNATQGLMIEKHGIRILIA